MCGMCDISCDDDNVLYMNGDVFILGPEIINKFIIFIKLKVCHIIGPCPEPENLVPSLTR
jgi:hypothetical protein